MSFCRFWISSCPQYANTVYRSHSLVLFLMNLRRRALTKCSVFTAALTVCLLGSQWSGISLCVISHRSFVLVLTKETFTSNTSFILQSPLMFGQDICFTSNVFSTIRRLILLPGDSNLSLTLAWLPHTFSGCLTYSNENKNWSLNVTLKPDTEFNSSYLCPHCTSSCLTKVNQFHDRSYFMISDNLNWVMLVWNSSQSLLTVLNHNQCAVWVPPRDSIRLQQTTQIDIPNTSARSMCWEKRLVRRT